MSIEVAETQSPLDQINEMQKRILAGEDIPSEDMHSVINQLRSERAVVSETATEKKVKKAKQSAPVDIAALFAKKTS